jgi:hypothetical protein
MRPAKPDVAGGGKRDEVGVKRAMASVFQPVVEHGTPPHRASEPQAQGQVAGEPLVQTEHGFQADPSPGSSRLSAEKPDARLQRRNLGAE